MRRRRWGRARARRVSEACIRVELARVVADEVRCDVMELPEGATLSEAIAQAVGQGLVDAASLNDLTVGVFGHARGPDHRLHAGDRIELTAGLRVDPKIARQRRVAKRRAAQGRDKWAPHR